MNREMTAAADAVQPLAVARGRHRRTSNPEVTYTHAPGLEISP